MATLGGVTQIGSFLLATASKEGNIANVLLYRLRQCTRAFIEMSTKRVSDDFFLCNAPFVLF
jgi:hypothetical protein